ncbi:MAG: hypothetical protein AABO58_25065 [Acidobacteriota bacterium]
MRATKVEAHEKSFFDTGVDSGGKKHILTPFEAAGVPIIGCKLQNGDTSFYYQEEVPKDRIVVHFTQGYLKGDVDTLTKPNNRARTHFATFTDAQYDATIKLLRFLTAKYAIPAAFLPPEKRYGIVNDVAEFRGITTHVNYRKDKWDIGPAFDWDQVVAGVTA